MFLKTLVKVYLNPLKEEGLTTTKAKTLESMLLIALHFIQSLQRISLCYIAH